jgi:alpha-L-arabinofuranosidase
MLLENQPLTGQNGLYATAAFDQNSAEIILKLVNASEKELKQTIRLDVRKRIHPKATLTVLKSDSPDAVNSIDQPRLVAPVEQPFSVKGKSLNAILAPNSLSVYKIKILQ